MAAVIRRPGDSVIAPTRHLPIPARRAALPARHHIRTLARHAHGTGIRPASRAAGGAQRLIRATDRTRRKRPPQTYKRHLDGGVCSGSGCNQCGTLIGLPVLGGTMNDPTGTTTCFGFLGFFASLFPRNWPFAMMILLATSSETSGRVCAPCANTAQTNHRPMRGNGWIYCEAR